MLSPGWGTLQVNELAKKIIYIYIYIYVYVPRWCDGGQIKLYLQTRNRNILTGGSSSKSNTGPN